MMQQPGRATPETGLSRGTLLVMAGEALAFPAGLIATILLTRHLPASDFGALALALAATAWLEWTVVSLFSRAGWKLIAEADDWRSVAGAVVRTFLIASLPVAALVFTGASIAANIFKAPQLVTVLRVLAFEIPLFVTAQAYRAVLIGRGMHGSRAAVAAVRWTVRALLVASGTLLGFSLGGIAVLIAAATLIELMVVRWRALGSASDLGETTLVRQHLTVRSLVIYAGPLALSAICMRLFERVDIFALRVLNGSLEAVAAYGVAQNLALAPTLFGSALTPAVIAALSYRLARGDEEGARQLSRDALRIGFLVLPLGLIAAGAAPALIDLMFGARYGATARLFSLLVLGAIGSLILALANGILVAAGRLRWTVVLTAPLLLLAIAGHLVFVPRYGAVGAATVTMCTAAAGAVAACVAARALVDAPIPVATLVRGLVLGSAAAWAMAAWHGTGITVVPVLALVSITVVIAMCVAGELRPTERARLANIARGLRRPAATAGVS